MDATDKLNFNTPGSGYSPYKFTRKNMIRKISHDTSTDLEVYETIILYKLSSDSANHQTYHISFQNILDTNPEIASKATQYTIDTGSSCVVSSWSTYPFQWTDGNDQMISAFVSKSAKEIIIMTMGVWKDFVVYIHIYQCRSTLVISFWLEHFYKDKKGG